jgi:hypothetical protein
MHDLQKLHFSGLWVLRLKATLGGGRRSLFREAPVGWRTFFWARHPYLTTSGDSLKVSDDVTIDVNRIRKWLQSNKRVSDPAPEH